MGKNLREKVTCSPIQNHPGFMWGLFDILKHNHWRYIKKRLPHKRPLCKKNTSGTKNEVNNVEPSPSDGVSISKIKVEDRTNVDSRQRPKKPSSAVKSKESASGEKSRRTHSEIKRSVKALIKALVLEDKSKRKSRHHRSSTYPVQPNPKESELGSSDKNKRMIGISPTVGSLNPLYLMSEESSNSDNDDFRVEQNTQVDGNNHEDKSDFEGSDSKKETDDDEDEEAAAWFDPKLKNEDDNISSPRQSKACLDALSLIHMNRNFLLKVLQDPGSPLARHFHSQQSFSSKTMTKAGSFPTHGSNRDDIVDSEATRSPSIAAEHRADGIQKFNEVISKLAYDEEDSSTRKRGKNQVVIKRFKDLRQKIKHVINENKNEKQRITMDAVLDKVPRNHGFSKDLKHEVLTPNLKGSSVTKPKQITRASSLCGSLDRYLQLYECSVQREAKDSEKPKVESEESPSKKVPKILGRILSSPEMKSPYALKIDDLPSPFISSKRSIEQVDDDEQVLEDIAEDHYSQSSEHEDLSCGARNLASMTETTEDLSCGARNLASITDTTEDLSCDARNLASMTETRQDREMSTLDAEPETELDQDTMESVVRSKVEAEDMEEVMHIEAKDKVKFNYVRDILEISGFNAPESLSTWQLDYQPLDPLVYEEANSTTTAAGCMIQDPECSSKNEGEEGGGNCNHVVLFDLINEVLIEIYERSYHYCPKPLSNQCRVHPMPLGYSVLKEVWVRISCYLRYKPQGEQSFDKVMSRDLSREDGWMDLQFESECVGIEVEDLIFEELLEELLVFG